MPNIRLFVHWIYKHGRILKAFAHMLYGGFYMSAHVLLNLLKELRKSE